MERTKLVIARQISKQDPTTGQTKFETIYEKYDEEKTFFKSQFTLANFNGGIAQPGNYTFPFQFQLPDGLPGNFNDHRHQFGNECRAAIFYKVKSNLDNIHVKDIKDKRYLMVVPRSWSIPQPVSCHNEKKFLLGGSGKLYLDAAIGKNVFVPGEIVPVHVVCNNESSKKVDKLKVKLMRDLVISCRGQVQKFTEEVNRNEFNGVDKKSKSDVVLNYTLPTNIFPSTQGSLISCKYHLDIECDVAMAFDLEVQPKIEIIYMPAQGQVVSLYDTMPKGCWK